MNILLTGGSGFLGSALAKALQVEGHQVSLLLRASSSLTRLKSVEHRFAVRRFENATEISNAIKETKPNVVIHTACSYGRSNETDLEVLEANFVYGAKILQFLSQFGGPVKFINVGTPLPSNVSVYALSKNSFVEWGKAIAQKPKSKIKFLNILLQHMYGEGDDPTKFTTKIIQACQSRQAELGLTQGLQRRDWIYIDDVVGAFLAILKNVDQFGVSDEVEVGTGVALTVREFAETVKKLTGSKTRLLFGDIPYRENEPMLCKANLLRMNSLGWKPLFDLETGLLKTLALEQTQ